MVQDGVVSDIQWRAPWHGGAEATHHQTRDQAQQPLFDERRI